MPEQCIYGIYLFFEDGERFYGGDRIVRVGTHKGSDNLMGRLREHYVTENHHRSIFRKHIGRAILNKRSDPYLEAWNIDFTTRANRASYGALRDTAREAEIEREVSDWLRQHTSFCLISEPDEQARKTLESGLIALLAQEPSCVPSAHWLGLWAPDSRMSESGLWNIQGLKGAPLTFGEVSGLASRFVMEWGGGIPDPAAPWSSLRAAGCRAKNGLRSVQGRVTLKRAQTSSSPMPSAWPCLRYSKVWVMSLGV